MLNILALSPPPNPFTSADFTRLFIPSATVLGLCLLVFLKKRNDAKGYFSWQGIILAMCLLAAYIMAPWNAAKGFDSYLNLLKFANNPSWIFTSAFVGSFFLAFSSISKSRQSRHKSYWSISVILCLSCIAGVLMPLNSYYANHASWPHWQRALAWIGLSVLLLIAVYLGSVLARRLDGKKFAITILFWTIGLFILVALGMHSIKIAKLIAVTSAFAVATFIVMLFKTKYSQVQDAFGGIMALVAGALCIEALANADSAKPLALSFCLIAPLPVIYVYSVKGLDYKSFIFKHLVPMLLILALGVYLAAR